MSKSTTSSETETTRSTVVCCGCTLTCDDILLEWQSESIRKTTHLCSRGQAWLESGLRAAKSQHGWEACRVQELKARFNEFFAAARSPAILGLQHVSRADQKALFGFAKSIRAAVSAGVGEQVPVHLAAFQNVGRVTGTFGEIARRCDTVVFWYGDPLVTHPRIVERLCRSAQHIIFVTEPGRNVNLPPNDSRCSELFLPRIESAAWLARNRLALPASDDPATATSNDDALMRRLQNSKRFALICCEAEDSWAGLPEILSIYEWIRRANDSGRAYLMPLRLDGNGQSAENVLSANTGFASGVGFGENGPRSHWSDYDASRMVMEGRIDRCLAITDGSEEETEWLRRAASKCSLAVGYLTTAPPEIEVNFCFPLRQLGIDGNGDVARNDDVLVPVNAVTTSLRLTLKELLPQKEPLPLK